MDKLRDGTPAPDSRFSLPASSERNRFRRSYSVLRESRRVIERSENEGNLIDEMCRIILRAGRYRYVWAGLLEENGKRTLHPVAAAESSGKCPDLSILQRTESTDGEILQLRAVRLNRPSLLRIGPASDAPQDLREQSERLGIRSILALPLRSGDRSIGVLSVYSAKPDAFDETEMLLLAELAHSMAFGIRSVRLRTGHSEREEELHDRIRVLQSAVESSIQSLAATIEMRDPYTTGHQFKTAEAACRIAVEMGLSADRRTGLYIAGVIHDIGKIYIPVEVLTKPAKLSRFEISLVQAHPRYGHDILKDARLPWPVSRIVLEHHERMDGSGYPRGLIGSDILLEARILAVADVLEAMTSPRPYRTALALATALQEISRNRGRLYDEAVVDACLRIYTHSRVRF